MPKLVETGANCLWICGCLWMPEHDGKSTSFCVTSQWLRNEDPECELWSGVVMSTVGYPTWIHYAVVFRGRPGSADTSRSSQPATCV